LKKEEIKNVIFDLGAVIIDIDPELTFQAFAALTGKDLKEIHKEFIELKIFTNYELGEHNDQQFRDLVRKFFSPDLTDDQIDNAWNAMLLDIPAGRIKLIKKLVGNYRVFLLSNTNAIHFRKVEETLYKSTGDVSFADFMEKVYLSYELKLSKPDPEIYRHVLKDSRLNPKETLFIDDSIKNVEAASELGIKTIHLQPPDSILGCLNFL
jgi:glucose-1-phosphatase